MSIFDLPEPPICFKCHNNIEGRYNKPKYFVTCISEDCEVAHNDDKLKGFPRRFDATKIVSCTGRERRSETKDRRSNV